MSFHSCHIQLSENSATPGGAGGGGNAAQRPLTGIAFWGTAVLGTATFGGGAGSSIWPFGIGGGAGGGTRSRSFAGIGGGAGGGTRSRRTRGAGGGGGNAGQSHFAGGAGGNACLVVAAGGGSGRGAAATGVRLRDLSRSRPLAPANLPESPGASTSSPPCTIIMVPALLAEGTLSTISPPPTIIMVPELLAEGADGVNTLGGESDSLSAILSPTL